MGKIVIERKKSINLRIPYCILIDGNLISEIENGQTKELDVENGEHTIIITSNQENFVELVGRVSGGLLGVLIRKSLDKVVKKRMNLKSILPKIRKSILYAKQELLMQLYTK